ncbi:MAG: hypothetical protein J6A75_06730, partial [Lachnospiraceae bacterium]|nr:hypothetical protein [Lachnospiraceae bacterium]
MIILKANAELKLVFQRLIQTMKVPVEWNGYFVVVGDYLILNGRVRSLFFNFENRKVVTNLIDITIDEEMVETTENRTKLQNVLNLALYAFGKWGSIQGLKVEKDYAQLNVLFVSVLKECSVEPGYTKENFRFYKDGIRINYEDVIGAAIAAEEKQPEEEPEGEEEIQGLWHKLVWKKQTAAFRKTETTFEQRQKNRMGNNFYMVGYLCPKCKKHLHMVVFPTNKEFRIETEEGGVLLARAYTCGRCNCFYTPRPDKLLVEGDIYTMDFMTDIRAYEDYMELLGENGDRVSNYSFNRFAAEKRRGRKQKAEALEEICNNLEEVPEEKLEEVLAKIEEGFYPIKSVKKLEQIIVAEHKNRKRIREEESNIAQSKLEREKRKSDKTSQSKNVEEELKEAQKGDISRTENTSEQESIEVTDEKKAAKTEKEPKNEVSDWQSDVPKEKRDAVKKRYEAKINVLEKLSERQIKELKKQLEKETILEPQDRGHFLEKIKSREEQLNKEYYHKLAAGCKQQNYARINKVIEEIERAKLLPEEKTALLQPLQERKRQQGDTEVRQIIERLKKNPGMQQYRVVSEQLKEYSDVDMTVHEPVLEEIRAKAEERELTSMIRHARTNTRADLFDLLERLKKQGFSDRLVRPYLEKVENKIRQMDEEELEKICPNPMQMQAEEAIEAYKKIEEGAFLPELKMHALEMLNKRLVKIKTDECELLVSKFKESLPEKIRSNERYHFYPARKVMMQEAAPEEMGVIEYALDTYGTTRGLFEYPILVIDTSRNQSGKEGMILTPENLYYNSLLSAYVISVWDIRKVWAQTGLLNSGIYIERVDGTKIKLPYALERSDLKSWADYLKDFIQYLQERPDSRTLPYLAREKHETICCFRCGYMYREGNV